MLLLKTNKPTMLTRRNVRLSTLLISSCKTRKGPFIATQLNTTQLDVELSCVAINGSLVCLSIQTLEKLQCDHYNCLYNFYHATRMHSADYAVARCPSVCLSVCHTPVLLSVKGYTYNFFHHPVVHHSSFSIPNGMAIFRREPPNGDAECKGV